VPRSARCGGMRSTGGPGDRRPRPSTPRSCPAFCSGGGVRVAEGWARRGKLAGHLAASPDDVVRRSQPGRHIARAPRGRRRSSRMPLPRDARASPSSLNLLDDADHDAEAGRYRGQGLHHALERELAGAVGVEEGLAPGAGDAADPARAVPPRRRQDVPGEGGGPQEADVELFLQGSIVELLRRSADAQPGIVDQDPGRPKSASTLLRQRRAPSRSVMSNSRTVTSTPWSAASASRAAPLPGPARRDHPDALARQAHRGVQADPAGVPVASATFRSGMSNYWSQWTAACSQRCS
jgi:hypothetical protein